MPDLDRSRAGPRDRGPGRARSGAGAHAGLGGVVHQASARQRRHRPDRAAGRQRRGGRARCASACRYPPLGTRGFGPRRPSNYGLAPTKDYLAESNRDLFVSVQIENKHALAVVEEIAAVPRLDSLVIGPADLSLSLGISMKDPQLREAMRRIIAAARTRGLSVGIGMGPDDDDFAVEAIGLGVNWLQVGGDFSYMVSFAAGLYGRIRERAKG